MLPYTGTFAALGVAIESGFWLCVTKQGGKIGGCKVQYFKVDGRRRIRSVEGDRLEAAVSSTTLCL